MPSDFSRATSWGCGVTLGIIVALVIIPALGWLFCCGGLALFTHSVAEVEQAQHRGQELRQHDRENGNYAAAGTEAAIIEPVEVKVVGWTIGNATGSRLGQPRRSSEEFLIVDLRIATSSRSRKPDYTSWHKSRRFDDDDFSAKDELGNSYRRVDFGDFDLVDGQVEQETIYHDRWVLDRIVLEKPVAAAGEIRLVLPAENVDGLKGEFRFRIPLHKPPADDKPAPKREATEAPATPSPEQIAEREADQKAMAERRAKIEAERQAEREAEKKATAKREADRKAKLAENDAATLLTLAKKLLDSDKPAAKKQLDSLIKQFPNTQAAAQARALLKSLN